MDLYNINDLKIKTEERLQVATHMLAKYPHSKHWNDMWFMLNNRLKEIDKNCQ